MGQPRFAMMLAKDWASDLLCSGENGRHLWLEENGVSSRRP